MGITISHLPASTPANIDGTAVVPMDDNTGVTVKATIPELTAAIGSTISALPAIVPGQFVSPAVMMLDGADGVTGSASLATLGIQVTPQQFGAVGDGSHDDTAAIQAAINSLTRGGIVYFPIGTYKITATLTIVVDGITIVGAGGWGAGATGTKPTAIEPSRLASGLCAVL